jgi:AAA domain
MENQTKQKITTILEAWLEYIALEEKTQAEVLGKNIDEELSLTGNFLIMRESIYNNIKKKAEQNRSQEGSIYALSFPQIYKIENGMRKFLPLFFVNITNIFNLEYRAEGWDISKYEFQPVTNNLRTVFSMDHNEIEQLIIREGIHRFLRLTFEGIPGETLSELSQQIKIPNDQLNNFTILNRPYIFKFEPANFSINLKKDLKKILQQSQSWAIPKHPAYEYLFGKPKPYQHNRILFGAFPIKFPPTDSQAKVLKHAKENPITAVQGPPGSGKTTLILHLIAQQVTKRALEIVDYNQDVDNLTIIASSNNRAVKNVVERLSKEIGDNFLFLEGGNKNLIRSNTIIEIQRALKWLDNNQFDPHKLQKLKQKLLELSGKFLIEEPLYRTKNRGRGCKDYRKRVS